METAEVKKGKKIRHCYPRKELYHRWIHSPEYVYTPKGGHACAGLGDYLRIANFYHEKTNDHVKECWFSNRDNIIAIIDRDNKRILINTRYNHHTWCVRNAVPDDFEVFYTNDVITNPDILKNDKEIFKTHSKYLIEQIVDNYRYEYLCIANRIKNIHNYSNYHNEEYINNLKEFVKKHKLKKFDFYKEHFGNYLVKEHNAWNAKQTLILLPSIRDILTDKMFSKKDKLKIEQHKFYTKYCKGNGVSFKFLIENWDKVPTKKEAIKYFENKTEFRNQNQWIEDNNELTWQQLIEKNDEILNKYIDNERKRNLKISTENYNKAVEELNGFHNYSINAWREGKVNSKREITYRCFVPNHRKGQIGKWETRTINNNINHFPNTQLKLNSNRDKISTSRGAVVPIEDAIQKFKFIYYYIKHHNKDYYDYNDKNIKFGIYTLRFLKYTDKLTDTKQYLGRKEWLIQIGCHSLWLDDIIDFIKYYHLEKEFCIEEEHKPDKNFKIQLKK